MRRLLFLVACTISLAGCGGGDESTDESTARVPVAEYVRRADDLCRDLAVKVNGLGGQQRIREIQEAGGSEADQLRALADVFGEQLQVISEFRQDVEAIGLPDAHADDAEQLLDETRSAEDELQRAIDAAREGDSGEFGNAISRYAGFSRQSASLARDSELNFAWCGAGA
jgi:hypothetical protein